MAETDDTGSADLNASEPFAPDPAPAAVMPKTVRRRGAPVWLVLGGILAAGIGYGVAQLVPKGWPIGSTTTLQSQLAAEIQQVQTLKSQITQLSQRLDAASALADRVAKLEAAPPPASNPIDVSALEARIATLEARPASDADPAAMAQLRSDVEVLKASGAGIVSPELQASLDAKVKETQAKLAAIEDAAKANAATTLARAALVQIAAALDSGAPYKAALSDLKGTPLPAVLTDHAASGLPTLQGLQADFPDAARAALEAGLRANMGQTWSQRVANFLRTQTGARALSPHEGNDPDAVLSRAEAATDKGDLTTALKEIATLPPEGIAAMADWQGRAQLRLDAGAAVQALMTQAG